MLKSLTTNQNKTNQSKTNLKKTILNNFHFFIFSICWIFVGIVGAVDAGLTVYLREGLKENEQNPIARIILANDDWDVSRFIGLKMFGTILVLGMVICIFKINTKYGLTIIVSLSIFQGLLLVYLLVY
jgi:hypothetical protein